MKGLLAIRRGGETGAPLIIAAFGREEGKAETQPWFAHSLNHNLINHSFTLPQQSLPLTSPLQR